MIDDIEEPVDSGDELEPVDLSRLYPGLTALADYYNSLASSWTRKFAATSWTTANLPQFNLRVPPSWKNPLSDQLSKQIAEFNTLNTNIRDSLAPLVQFYESQWKSVFESLGRIKYRVYPENLHDSTPTIDILEPILVEEGIPLMWVPGPKAVNALLEAPDAAVRRRVLSQRWRGIVNDCENALATIDHPDLHDSRGFALACVSALREGHSSAAQALAENLLDTLMRRHFDAASRAILTTNDFKKKSIRFKFDDYKIRVALTFAPVWYAHAKYWPDHGGSIPREFGRHPSAHAVSRAQYSRINSIIGLMLVTSVLKFFDLELSR
ncbi:hypothetical protein [Allosalinactinospora lopnorensis]|uniref:hypothetical protein n=1 Tax=Allosalinactinospora lopnorensis TaxID=1352348 RepID=UPI0012E2A214|nr:hypothetical protein [Allosalinactinospora lopnorensis]